MLLGIAILAFLIILAIKGFIECTRLIGSYKSEIKSKYKEDRKTYED